MTDPQDTQHDTDLDRESPTSDAPDDGDRDLGEEGATADYETRMREFDNVDSSTPVVSLPVESRDLDERPQAVTSAPSRFDIHPRKEPHANRQHNAELGIARYSVIIKGDGLDAADKLLFGDESVPFKVTKTGSIEANVPSGSARSM